MADVRDEYLRALYSLSKVDAGKWATFVEAFKALTFSEYERALSMSAGDTQIAVGMGRRMRDLRDDFLHIDTLADKIRRAHGTL